MNIVFENQLTKEKVMVSRENHGVHARSIMAAYVNSSDLSPNKQEDFGWRLIPEQMAMVQGWMEDPAKVREISDRYGVPIEELAVYDFVNALADENLAEDAAQMSTDKKLREAEADYQRRVKAILDGSPLEVPEVKPVAKPSKK